MTSVANRVQVFFTDQHLKEISLISQAEGISMSKLVSQGWDQYSNSEEYGSRLVAANKLINGPKLAIMELVGDLSAETQTKIYELLDL